MPKTTTIRHLKNGDWFRFADTAYFTSLHLGEDITTDEPFQVVNKEVDYFAMTVYLLDAEACDLTVWVPSDLPVITEYEGA